LIVDRGVIAAPVAGIDRLNRVQVELSRETVVISWAGREQLLDRAGEQDGADELRRCFQAVGATRRVRLDAARKRLVLAVLAEWIEIDDVPFLALPDGIYDLWVALEDERAGGLHAKSS
jgi:hypothetical protein